MQADLQSGNQGVQNRGELWQAEASLSICSSSSVVFFLESHPSEVAHGMMQSSEEVHVMQFR